MTLPAPYRLAERVLIHAAGDRVTELYCGKQVVRGWFGAATCVDDAIAFHRAEVEREKAAKAAEAGNKRRSA